MKRRLYYSVDLRIKAYTEPVPLKYGELAMDIQIFLQCIERTGVQVER